MARIQPIDPATAPDDVREALENLPALNIFRTLAHAETAFRPFLRFGGAVLGRLSLDPVVRELAILTVAKEAEAEYEWIQHVAIAKHLGVTDEQIDELAKPGRCAPETADGRASGAAARRAATAGSAASGGAEDWPFDEAQQAAIDLAGCVVRGPHISNELFAAVRAQFSDREIVELLLTIGDYLMLARVMTVLQIDRDEPVGDAVLRGRRDRPGHVA